MAIKAEAITVTTSATNLLGVDGSSQYRESGYTQTLLVKVPTGGATVYVGGDNTVTTSTGFPLDAGQSLALQVRYEDQVYAIAGSSQAVRVLRTDV